MLYHNYYVKQRIFNNFAQKNPPAEDSPGFPEISPPGDSLL